MNTIKVVDFLNSSNLLSSSKANTLYSYILEQLEKFDSITLDFSGYESISSIFLNYTLGNLIVDKKINSKEQLFDIVNIVGLSDDDREEVILSVQNAIFKNNLLLEGKNIEDIYSSYLTY
ncbi:MAG: STAS-like domain-containing protein [Melioribacteraceae bacterium]